MNLPGVPLSTPSPLRLAQPASGHTTRGYNLAEATFHALGKMGQRLTAHLADHGPLDIEVAITVLT
jgi:hypothetical protein